MNAFDTPHPLRAPQQQLGPVLVARQFRQTDDDKRGLAHGPQQGSAKEEESETARGS
jgi:hypothetical protein